MHQFTPIVVDGLDGSGKATTLATISQILVKSGFDVLKVEYPNYDLPWGILIRDILHDKVKADLTLKEKMLLYALNRVESLPLITASVHAIHTENTKNPLVMLFDRFPTSNVLTTAYYFQLHPPGSVEKEIVRLLKYMDQIDHIFYETLGLKDVRVNIPLLQSRSVIDAMKGDNTREALDNYEIENVQQQAARLYKILSEKFPKRFYLFSQYKKDGSRMSPDEIALHILEKNLPTDIYEKILSDDVKDESDSQMRGSHSELEKDKKMIDQILIDRLLEEFGTDKVSNLNPYKG